MDFDKKALTSLLSLNDEALALELEKLGKSELEKYKTLMAYYRCAMMEIETKFNVLNVEYSLRLDRNPISSIHTRLKKPKSIAQKLPGSY